MVKILHSKFEQENKIARAFKLHEKIWDAWLNKFLEKNTVDAALILGRLTKEFRFKRKMLFCVFVDLENFFHCLPSKVIWFALRKRHVPKYLINGIALLQQDFKTTVSVEEKLSDSSSVKAGVH